MSENQHIPLWKQLLGAVTGATVALLLYGGFVAVSPNLSGITAYLLKDMPAYQRSPRTVRNDAIAWREALGGRVRAATAQLQSSQSPSSVSAAVPSEVKNQRQREEAVPEKIAKLIPTKKQNHRSEQKEKKQADPKRKEEKLPNTGVPLWAMGGVALCLAMSVRYRRKILGNH
ncbi:hypothetical protein HYW11_03260 [Candidatus Peregrinibacteria bacterium]|nr:hypothetical protein [Candidatus Peregrinibacteria bacterium]